jgi:hypothetical protein
MKGSEASLSCSWYTEYCGSGYYEQVDFSHDGRVATFYLPETHVTTLGALIEAQTTVMQASMQPTGPGQSIVTLRAPLLIEQLFLQGGYYTPEDVLLNVYEFDSTGCWLTERLTTDLTVAGTRSVGDICGNASSGSGFYHRDPAMQLRAAR